ncbi:MAG TPA: gluconokinase [Flavisolibacter sp.]|nr:gluconokinase [Flavisolibacter sp.]
MEYILGTDIGTGSVKTVILDFSGKVLGGTHQYYPTLNPQPGWQEQDPDTIFNGFINCIREAIGQMGVAPVAVALSSAMHSLMAVNDEGAAISRLLLWSDNRSASIADELRNSNLGRSIYAAGGAPIHAMTPICKLAWWRQHDNQLFQRASKFISIKEYIWWRLFGEYRIDYSLASATGLFDIGACSWNDAALSFAGIEPRQLSEPVPVSYRNAHIHTRYAKHMHLDATTPFVIGASDGCLANVGTQALTPGTAAITIGTSAAVRIARPEPIRQFSFMPFNYMLDENNFICGGPVNNGGNILAWSTNTFFSSDTSTGYDQVFKKIENVPAGCNGLVFLPYLNGERSPVWDERTSALFFGIKPQHDAAHFLRASIEGVCFALRQVLLLLEGASGPIHEIHVSGGFVHSNQWVQLLADITGKRLVAHGTEDASAVGAAYLGLKTMKVVASYSSLHHAHSRQFEPDRKLGAIYEKNWSVFEKLYPLLKDLMHQN